VWVGWRGRYIETSAKAAEERLEELAVARKDVEGRRKGLEDAKARKEKVEAEEKGREDAVVKDKLAALRKALGVEPGATEDRLKEVYEKIKHRHGETPRSLELMILSHSGPGAPRC
jgi:peptidoglycan hydrolase CwlO-like protein